MVENTTQRDPAAHLLGMVSDGTEGYILGQEAEGGAQLVASSLMPTDSPWGALELLGFVKGEPVPGDDLFVNCTLPAGWTRESLSDPRGSVVLDERGVARVSVFYKAAYYDRKANAYLINIGSHYATEAIYGEQPPALPDVWDKLVDTEREDFWAHIEAYTEKAAEHPSIYGDRLPRVTAVLALR